MGTKLSVAFQTLFDMINNDPNHSVAEDCDEYAMWIWQNGVLYEYSDNPVCSQIQVVIGQTTIAIERDASIIPGGYSVSYHLYRGTCGLIRSEWVQVLV